MKKILKIIKDTFIDIKKNILLENARIVSSLKIFIFANWSNKDINKPINQ